MKRFSPTLIGIFVIGALILGTIGLFSFGGQAWWREKETIALYFNESIHGLETGSAVRLMGVRVGQVSAINVRYSEGKTAVQVLCEVDRSPTVSEGAIGNDIRERDTLEQMVADGLQARLDLIGITGMLFVEMDFFEEPPERAVALKHPEHVVVPTVGSVLTGVTDNLADIARELGNIDFAGLGESASRLLDHANATLEEARVDELFERLHVTVGRVNELLESGALQETLASAAQSFEDLSQLTQALESRVDPLAENFSATSDELRETLRRASGTLSALEDLVGPRLGLGSQMAETLTTLEEAARSVERLAEFLERNPQAILRGSAGER